MIHYRDVRHLEFIIFIVGNQTARYSVVQTKVFFMQQADDRSDACAFCLPDPSINILLIYLRTTFNTISRAATPCKFPFDYP